MDRKIPCSLIGTKTKCSTCQKVFSRAYCLRRHQNKGCKHTDKELDELKDNLEKLSLEIEQIKTTPATVHNVGNPVGNVLNVLSSTNNLSTNVCNNVNINITPWGRPLELSDQDVETVLARVLARLPGAASTLSTKHVADALMHAVQLSHTPEAARNIYLDPKQSDRVLVMTEGNTWGYLHLVDALPVMMDSASVRIAAPAAIPIVPPNPYFAMKAAIPAKYLREKDDVLCLNKRPMGVHLANMAPGGSGPVMLPAASATATATAPALPPPVEFTIDEASQLVNDLETDLETNPNALDVEWLKNNADLYCITVEKLARTIHSVAIQGLCDVALGNRAIDELFKYQYMQRDLAKYRH